MTGLTPIKPDRLLDQLKLLQFIQVNDMDGPVQATKIHFLLGSQWPVNDRLTYVEFGSGFPG